MPWRLETLLSPLKAPEYRVSDVAVRCTIVFEIAGGGILFILAYFMMKNFKLMQRIV